MNGSHPFRYELMYCGVFLFFIWNYIYSVIEGVSECIQAFVDVVSDSLGDEFYQVMGTVIMEKINISASLSSSAGVKVEKYYQILQTEGNR